MRYIQYSRKSSEGDERQVQSIPDQESVLDRFAKQHQLQIVAKFSEAHSAKTPGNRPIFENVLRQIKRGDADGILCWHLNRLSRNPVDSGQLAWMLQQGLIKCIKTPEREYRPEDNVVIMAVENAVANQYILDLKKNIRRGQDEKAARGWWPHKPPPGYVTNPETKEIDIDPNLFPLMRRAWELMLTGSYTVAQVHVELNHWGFQDRFRIRKVRHAMGRSRLYVLFSNPFYYGVFRYSGEPTIGRHRPMVTKEEFDLVQAYMRRPGRQRPQKHRFAYTGLITCGQCACQFTAERRVKHYRKTNRTATYVYYHCTGNRGCSKHGISEAYIDAMITHALDRCSLDQGFATWSEATVRRDQGLEPDWSQKLFVQHRARLRETESQLDRLLDLRLSGELEAEEYQTRKARLREAMLGFAEAIARLESKGRRDIVSFLNALTFARYAPQKFAQATPALKRQIASVFASRYVVTLGVLTVQVHPILAKFASIEPPKDPSDMVRAGASATANPGWCSLLDDVRTLMRNNEISFPQLECIHQAQNLKENDASEQQSNTGVA